MRRVVIVGAGQGGTQVAMSLRQEGFEGEIVLIGDEAGLPYQRPPLSKAYMKDGDAQRLTIRQREFFETAGITLLTGRRVVALDRAAAEVVCDDGTRIGYGSLVLATGARNLRPPVDGLDRRNVHDLRSLEDARRLREAMGRAHRAAVIGGGFIGLEFAAVARMAGLDVVVLEAAPRLMARVVSPPISARFLAAHRAMGVDVRLGSAAVAVTGPEGGVAEAVRLADGGAVACDMVVVATGVAPNVDLAREAGLAVADGIVVDAALRTSDPAISALGDCAAYPGPHGRAVRLESVQAATDHARHIARRIVSGGEEGYAAVPWFWSDQGDLRLQIAGLAPAAETHVALPDEATAEIVLGFAADGLVSVETVNAPGPHMAARRLLARPQPPGRAELEAAGWDLRAAAKAG